MYRDEARAIRRYLRAIHADVHEMRERLNALEPAQKAILKRLDTLGVKIMASLDETLEKVTAANTKTDSLIALFKGLKLQLADVLAGVTLPPGVQAKVDAMFKEASDSVAEVDEAINENVPA